MASIQEKQRKTGRAYLVQFFLNGRRRSLYLDTKYDRADAEEVKRVVERCIAAIETEAPLERRARAWLESASDDMKQRFVACGLVEGRDECTIGELFDAFIKDAEKRVKPNSIRLYRYSRNTFFKYVSQDAKLCDFQRKDALKFVTDLGEIGLARASTATIISVVKTAFGFAVDRELLDKSPFARIAAGQAVNKRREYYVDMETFDQMIAACGSIEGAAALTLCRVAGLRRGEVVEAQWRDVDFDRGRMIVRSPKTERIEGKDRREIPLFPRVRKVLLDLTAERNGDLGERIVSFNCGALYRIAKAASRRAGIPSYPRALQNLRSSASIDIHRRFGDIAENAWLGHTESVAKGHYLHVLDADFDRATTE